MKICPKCYIVRDNKEFNKEQYYCKQCYHLLYINNKQKYAISSLKCKRKDKKRSSIWNMRFRSNNPQQYILSRVKHYSKCMNIEFNIELEDIIIPEECPVLGIRLINYKNYTIKDKVKSGSMPYNAPSIDRIDNSRGYVKGNVQIISWKANRMKNKATKEQLLDFSEWVLNKFKDCQNISINNTLIEHILCMANRKRVHLKGNFINDTEVRYLIKDKCPIFRTPFSLNLEDKYTTYPNFDRIDPSKGYISGNVQIISALANKIKSNASYDELYSFSKWIQKNYSCTKYMINVTKGTAITKAHKV